MRGRFINTNPLEPWNDPASRDDLDAPWNNPCERDNPSDPWNQRG